MGAFSLIREDKMCCRTTYGERQDHKQPSVTANSPSVSNGCVDSVNDARIAYSGELRVDIFVEHHVDEHNEKDEGIRPRSICNELLHHNCFSPALPYAI